MDAALQKLVNRIETQRSAILNSFRTLTAEQFNRVPAPGKWAASEVLSHIIAAERMSLAYMQKKMQGIDQAALSGTWEEVKIMLLKISQRLPGIKFKAPRRVVENTTFYRDFASIESEWGKVRNELRELLDQFPQHGLKRLIYKHPAAGYLNIRHALIFFHEHLHHHLPQLRKLLK
jgi:hypothetical protein